jgi:hypothetical protein
MSEGERLLFESDPRRFMELVAADDLQARVDAFQDLDDLLICEIARFGVTADIGMMPHISRLYQDHAMQVAVEHRMRLYESIAAMVEQVSAVSAKAFLPFIVEDDARGIVSTAVVDYVSLAPLTDNDPMSRPNDIIGMIEGGVLKNEGAAFGALLNIGDARVCRLLRPVRDQLDEQAIDEAVGCSTGILHSAAVEFWIDWLEGMTGDTRDGRFGSVASGIALAMRVNRFDQVFTGQRPFPIMGVSQEQWNALGRPISLPDYVKQVAPRLYALERSEPPPRVMPYVLRAWGLEPATDPQETAGF